MSRRKTNARARRLPTVEDFLALTAGQLRDLAADLDNRTDDMLIDAEQIEEEAGYDKIHAWRAVAEHLRDEALRRDTETGS